MLFFLAFNSFCLCLCVLFLLYILFDWHCFNRQTLEMMTNQKKLIIFACAKDVTENISSIMTGNMSTIHLDDKTHSASSEHAVKEEESLQNSSCSSVYKRIYDLLYLTRAKSSKNTKKATDLHCVVCGDNTLGFHYSAITCNSCKTFFNRNGLQPMVSLSSFFLSFFLLIWIYLF